MRVHIYLDDELVEQLDEIVGDRGRSAYIEEAVRERLDRERRWRLMRQAFGSISDSGHPWDPDVAGVGTSQPARGSTPRGLMAPVVVDTTVLIDVLKGRPGTLARYEALQPSGDDPYVCAITVEEVSAGLRPPNVSVSVSCWTGSGRRLSGSPKDAWRDRGGASIASATEPSAKPIA